MKKTASVKRIGEIEGVILREGDGPDVRIADLSAFVHDAEEGGYWAEVPALPGCLTQAETLDQLVANLDEAIRGWLASQSLDELKALNVPFTVLVGEDAGNSSSRHPLIRNLQLAA
jgi:predicted RNase H-like HicB family nuclease